MPEKVFYFADSWTWKLYIGTVTQEIQKHKRAEETKGFYNKVTGSAIWPAKNMKVTLNFIEKIILLSLMLFCAFVSLVLI